MNPAERASTVAMAWTATYTRHLPHELAQARRDELASDLWEQRADAADHGGSAARTALAIARRTLTGIPADLAWRHEQRRAVARTPERQRIDGRWIMANDRTLFTRARTRLSTRRCVACGERYRRRYPYCPVCKTKKGHDGIPKNPNWPAGMG